MNNLFDKRTLIPNVKIVAKPVIILVSSLGLLIFLLINYYPKVSSMFSNYDKAKKQNQKLQDRIRVLREFQIDAKDQIDISSLALPINNPGTLVLSYIKNLSTDYKIEITDVSFKTTGTNNKKDKWKSMDLTLETRNSNISDNLNFLSDITKIIPIVTIDGINIKINESFTSSTSKIKLYWSDPPETIPSLNSPVQNLTEKELKTLSLVKGLKTFELTKLQPGNFTEGRINPFN